MGLLLSDLALEVAIETSDEACDCLAQLALDLLLRAHDLGLYVLLRLRDCLRRVRLELIQEVVQCESDWRRDALRTGPLEERSL